MSPKPPRSCELLATSLLAWFDRSGRKLPWRAPRGRRPNPWHVLVSELMLQQTQVSTVIPYFERFLNSFPTPAHLAAADVEIVLRHWQGLGYYRRARYLHAAAQVMATNYNGLLPLTLKELRALPGVGPYTAGAIASLAHGLPEPLVDGNVARVLCRLDGIRKDPKNSAVQKHLWKRAAQILPVDRPGDFNSALMDLGATICTPRSPECPKCPLQNFCLARQKNIQNLIPAPPPKRKNPILRRWVFCLRHRNRWLIERRPDTGRWAGMWQFATTQATSKSPDTEFIRRYFAARVTTISHLVTLRHALSHRQYIFKVFLAGVKNAPKSAAPRRWATISTIDLLPLPAPHAKVLKLLRSVHAFQ